MFFCKINSQNINSELIRRIREQSDRHKLKKGTVISQTGIYLFSEGAVRVFIIDTSGTEQTVELFESNCLIFNKPTDNHNNILHIECLTMAACFELTTDALNRLLSENPDFIRDLQYCQEKSFLKLLDTFSQNSLPAMERYQRYLLKEPWLSQKTPVKYLASYLGIHANSLSRLRRNYKKIQKE